MSLPNNLTLRRGDSGEYVRILQGMLAMRGYFPQDAMDGEYGGDTVSGVVKFQSQNGLFPDGIAGPRTIRRLNGLPDEEGGDSGWYGSSNPWSIYGTAAVTGALITEGATDGEGEEDDSPDKEASPDGAGLKQNQLLQRAPEAQPAPVTRETLREREVVRANAQEAPAAREMPLARAALVAEAPLQNRVPAPAEQALPRERIVLPESGIAPDLAARMRQAQPAQQQATDGVPARRVVQGEQQIAESTRVPGAVAVPAVARPQPVLADKIPEVTVRETPKQPVDKRESKDKEPVETRRPARSEREEERPAARGEADKAARPAAGDKPPVRETKEIKEVRELKQGEIRPVPAETVDGKQPVKSRDGKPVTEAELKEIARKAEAGEKLTKEEQKILKQAEKQAEKGDKAAVIAQGGRELTGLAGREAPKTREEKQEEKQDRQERKELREERREERKEEKAEKKEERQEKREEREKEKQAASEQKQEVRPDVQKERVIEKPQEKAEPLQKAERTAVFEDTKLTERPQIGTPDMREPTTSADKTTSAVRAGIKDSENVAYSANPTSVSAETQVSRVPLSSAGDGAVSRRESVAVDVSADKLGGLKAPATVAPGGGRARSGAGLAQ